MDRIAKAEYGNVPVGADFLACLSQSVGVLTVGALQRKYPANAWLAKWGNTVVGGAGAVVVPQLGKYVGEATAKSLSIGLACQAGAPWLGALFNKIFYPPAAAAGRKAAQKKIAGAGTQSSQTNPMRRMDLNGEAAAKDLGATLH